MRPDRYVVEHVMTCAELRELIGYAQAHIDNCPVPVPDAESLLRRVEIRLLALGARDADPVYLFVADGP